MATNGKREAAALALATGQTVRDAAVSCQVGERTLHRWLVEDAAFGARVFELRKELFGQAVGRLAKLAGKATDTLEQLLAADSDSVKLQAARTILEAGCKLREQLEMEERLARLEAFLAERGKR